jgi:predicted histone-like DNA-binding protein
MPIKINLVQRGNPQNRDEPKKWYAQVKSDGDVSLKELGKEISQRCTVNYVDVLAVLEALNQTLTQNLSGNKIVRFGDIGSFRIGAGSEGAETKEQFTSSMIKSKKVIFTPGEDIKVMLNNLKFEKND